MDFTLLFEPAQLLCPKLNLHRKNWTPFPRWTEGYKKKMPVTAYVGVDSFNIFTKFLTIFH